MNNNPSVPQGVHHWRPVRKKWMHIPKTVMLLPEEQNTYPYHR